MSNDELRVKCHELRMGYKVREWSGCEQEGRSDLIPDYPNDLQACAQLRASLTEEERERYTSALYSLTQSRSHNSSWNIDWSAIDATAEQHCIAYLKTKQAI